MDNFLMKRDKNTFLDQQAMANQIINAVLDGEVDPLIIDVHLKAIEDVIKSIRKNVQVQNKTVEAASLYPEKVFTFMDATITQTGKKTFDFTYCNDPVWDSLQKEKKDVDEKIKKRQGLLKGIETSMEYVDPSNGEIFEIHEPDRKEKSFLKIEFK